MLKTLIILVSVFLFVLLVSWLIGRMRVRFLVGHWIPQRLGVLGIALFPYVLLSSPETRPHDALLKHEMAHVKQVRQRGWLWFYVRYGAIYLGLFV